MQSALEELVGIGYLLFVIFKNKNKTYGLSTFPNYSLRHRFMTKTGYT